MGFDLERFRREDLQPRRIEVKTPELAAWFGPDADPLFVVRGLTGEEFYRVREAAAKRRDLEAIASRIMSGAGEAIAQAIDEFYGAVPDEFARRVEILLAGCVEPALSRDMAMKLFKSFPSTAHILADNILKATGEGAVPGESKGSGGTPASATT
jgi:hypothetical protein